MLDFVTSLSGSVIRLLFTSFIVTPALSARLVCNLTTTLLDATCSLYTTNGHASVIEYPIALESILSDLPRSTPSSILKELKHCFKS